MIKVVLLGGKGTSTNIVYNYLADKIDIEMVILEDHVSKKVLLKNRIKKLGLFYVIGQILFMLMVIPVLKIKSKKRIQEIITEFGLNYGDEYMNSDKCHFVDSINSDETIDLLNKVCPDLIIVNGTRIISKRVIECTNALMINMHAGITPKYRGTHGGYWAKYNNDEDHCGVTVHLIDTGIDTGNVLYQSIIQTTAQDNFYTYPYLQMAYGLPDELQAVIDVQNGRVKPLAVDLPSKLYYHPTIWQYLTAYLFRKVK